VRPAAPVNPAGNTVRARRTQIEAQAATNLTDGTEARRLETKNLSAIAGVRLGLTGRKANRRSATDKTETGENRSENE
jgi:hypothetical protein